MNRLTISALAFAAAASISGVAMADGPQAGPPKGPPTLPPAFEKMDADHDGKITKAEFEKGMSDRLLTAFEKLDANKDGVVSKDEFLAGKNDQADRMFDRMDTNHDGVIDEADRQNHGMRGPRPPEGEVASPPPGGTPVPVTPVAPVAPAK